MTEEVLMVPAKDFQNLVQYYKGELTENALLNKAARLAAESHVLLKDKSRPAGLVNARVKPLVREQTKLTKRLRQFPISGIGASEKQEIEEDEGDLVTGPLDQMLKQLIKVSTVKRSSKLSDATPGGSRPVKKSKTEPSISERFKRIQKKLQPDPSKKTKAKRKTEAERLKPLSGWEDWAKGRKLRRQLSYDDDEED